VPTYRIRDAAQLLAVSDDTLRRWIDAGRIAASQDGTGPLSIEGSELARFAEQHAASTPQLAPLTTRESARNHFVGLVTKVTRDKVMAQVELQSGPNRIVSLMSREAADDLGLEPGVLAVASIKSTNVVIELPDHP